MDFLTIKYLLWAVALGALSAVSLPLGSAIGLNTRPRAALISVLSAFGAGALLAALSVELVAPTVFALGEGHGGEHGGDPRQGFYALVVGAVAGGLIYYLLDKAVNSKGAFLRRTASTISHLRKDRRQEQLELVKELSEFPLLQKLPAEHIDALVSRVSRVQYEAGEPLLRVGERLREAVFVLEGQVQVSSSSGDLMGDLGSGDTLGVAALVAGIPSVGTVKAKDRVSGLALSRQDFEELRHVSSEFDEACRELTAQRLQLMDHLVGARHEQAHDWIEQATSAVATGGEMPDTADLQQAREEHGGSPLAIWLGILIDGIPESFVIGAGLLVSLTAAASSAGSLIFWDIVPYTLIAGLFLSNFPEALASSANMRRQGWGKKKVFWLWLWLMIVTAVGAGAGFFLADSLSHTFLVFAEGLAAGAMLTMIASAMIPEAVHMGSAHGVGLSTLAGFLAAISFKLLE